MELKSSYTILDTHKYDPSKKNIILFLLERNIGKKGVYLTYKYILNAVSVLQRDFNVFLIPKTSSKMETWLETVRTTDVLKDCIYISLDPYGEFLNPETTGEKAYYEDDKAAYQYTFDYMQQNFTELLESEKWIFDGMVGTISSAIFLPYERNHEIIPHDEKTQKLLDGAHRTATRRLRGEQQFFSFRMASQRTLFPFYFLLRLMKDFDVFHYSFSHDTTSIWYPFVPALNPMTDKVKLYYFVDDKRGMRDFHEFPSGPLQDAFGKVETPTRDLEWVLHHKSHDFIFGGTFPYDVGYRLNDWKRFFQNLNCDALIRTQTDGTSTISESEIKDPLETRKFKNKKIKDEAAFEVIRSIYESPYVKPTVSQEEYLKEQQSYKFTIILKCFYGKYDSLNFRIYSSLINGILPLIADDYDVDDLQIPPLFKSLLVVSNNEDIERAIKYFKDYPHMYETLFFAMYRHYVKPEHFNKEWYHKEFKNNYFKELYV